MNTSALVSSLRYLNSNFNLVTGLSSWIYTELSASKYSGNKLCKIFNDDQLELAESLIHLNQDTAVLDKLLETSSINLCYRRISMLLKHGVDAHKLILDTSSFGNLEVFRLLLESGADANTNNQILFRNAISNQYSEIVDLLIQNGNDIHYRCDEALRFASSRGYRKIVKSLLDAGADVSAEYEESLRFASRNGHVDVVKMLIDAGSRVDGNNNEALTFACYNGYITTIRLLLNAGADPHDNEDQALRYAQRCKHKKVIRLLMKK